MALRRDMAVVANNMANVNTPAYKNEQMMFRTYLMQVHPANRAMGNHLAFVQDVGIFRNTSEGPLVKTGNPLDFALHGDGFFQVQTAAGMRYTRNGHFRLDQNGIVVDSDGHAVMNTRNQPIIVAPNEQHITVASDGTVSTENGIIAKLKVVHFPNDQDLRPTGNSLYETTQPPETILRPEVVQGMLEQSNVKPVIEMTHLIEIMRQYESNQKIIEEEGNRRDEAMKVLSGVQ
jgi:flagellar basal-body rod protein FlgF